LRLLFIRELEFPKCLILWDAIFAVDRLHLSLVEYIFVGLLTCLRDKILLSDVSNCMRLLSQPHTYLDTLDVLKRALYLKSPEIYSIPESMSEAFIVINTDSDYSSNGRNSNKTTLRNYSHQEQPQRKKSFNTNSNENPYKHTQKIKQFEGEMNVIQFESMQHNKDLVTHMYINKVRDKSRMAHLHEFKFKRNNSK
jgi:hypothetical protein